MFRVVSNANISVWEPQKTRKWSLNHHHLPFPPLLQPLSLSWTLNRLYGWPFPSIRDIYRYFVRARRGKKENRRCWVDGVFFLPDSCKFGETGTCSALRRKNNDPEGKKWSTTFIFFAESETTFIKLSSPRPYKPYKVILRAFLSVSSPETNMLSSGKTQLLKIDSSGLPEQLVRVRSLAIEGLWGKGSQSERFSIFAFFWSGGLGFGKTERRENDFKWANMKLHLRSECSQDDRFDTHLQHKAKNTVLWVTENLC